MSKSVRIGVVLCGLLITAGLGYRAWLNERALSDGRRDHAAIDRAAEQAAVSLTDLRASLHAYVAPGQGLSFWAARATAQLDTLREQLLVLEAALAASGGSLAEALDGLDQLSATEKRARLYADRGEALLAGDVIFTEIRDLLSSASDQVAAARQSLHRGNDRQVAGLRQEQAALALGAVALWLIIALVMLPVAAVPVVKNPNEWRQNLAVALKKPAESAATVERVKPVEPVAAAEPGVPVAAVASAGEICSDLSTLSDVGALSGALERAANVLGATGVIVWVASNDGSTLSPVATHGFDARLVARIGKVARESSNLTAMAFRENAARVSAPTVSSPAAVAVAMCGPSGPVGVLSAEMRPGRPADEACVALATIFAAQLATLASPVAAPVAGTQAAAR